jgi:hypothetical protein
LGKDAPLSPSTIARLNAQFKADYADWRMKRLDAVPLVYYELLDKKSLKLQNRVSDIVRSVSFDTTTTPPDLAEALRYFQHKRDEVEGNAPRAFLEAG